MRYQTDNIIVYDLEVFPGWFLAGFQLPDGRVWQYQTASDGTVDQTDGLNHFLRWVWGSEYTLAGFNSIGYDDPVLSQFLIKDGGPVAAYEASKNIIVNRAPPWTYDNRVRSIDLMQILPGRIGLKKIGVCLGHHRLQELPIPFDKSPSPQERQTLLSYNINDLEITRKLLDAIQPELDLRGRMSEQYGVDLRSKGEATLAELIILEEYKRKKGDKARTKKELNEAAFDITYSNPEVAIFEPSWWGGLKELGPRVGEIHDLGLRIFADLVPLLDGRLKGGVLNRRVYLDDRYYAMGVGGLHSVDGPGCWIPNDDQVLLDVDVASYYPNIILTQGLSPRQWGKEFLEIYADIVARRLKAKREGDKVTAQILKISANGTYGKSSDLYSSLYDPQLTVNVTVIGQLALLVLIAMLDGTASVVSANTDGITVLADKRRRKAVEETVGRWERLTGFEMEYTQYDGLWQKDVNNYIARKSGGGIKTKGRFVADWPDLRHTPNANIVAIAVQKWVEDGADPESTIYGCEDINQFLLTQSLTGGYTSSWNGMSLGKILRFYKSNRHDAAPIVRTPGPHDKGNEGTVSNSDGCIPVDDLPREFPKDMNYGWYVEEARKLIELISRPKRLGMNRWAEFMHRQGLRPAPVNPRSDILSRAAAPYGEIDFASMDESWVIGTETGDGLMVREHEDHTEVFAVTGPFPSKTRKKVRKDHGFVQYYGPRVAIEGPYIVHRARDEIALDEFYTDAELRKVR